MGVIKTMKEVESALPQKKEINYVRALDKNGNPILINKDIQNGFEVGIMGLGPHGTILHSISKAFNQLFWPGI